MLSIDAISQVVSSGLLMGTSYALVAIGFTLVFGVMNIVNFSHGHLVMAAMFGSYSLYRYLGWDPYLAGLVVVPLAVLVGILLYKAVIRTVTTAPQASQMLATMGLLIMIENAANLVFGGEMRSVTASFGMRSLALGDLALPWTRLIAAAGSLFAVAAIWALLRYTRFGAEIRAAANNRIGAVVVGIRIDAVFLRAFIISVCSAALAGALIVPFYLVNPYVGHAFILKSFIIAIVGGLGSLPGAFVAGLLVGLLEAAGDFFLTSSFGTAMVFALLILVLLIKPAGLFGTAKA